MLFDLGLTAMLAFRRFGASELDSHRVDSQMMETQWSWMAHTKVPQSCISFRVWSWMSRCGPGFPALMAGNAARDCDVAVVQWDIVDDLLPVDFLHLAHDRVVLSCQKVVIAFVIPIVSLLSEESEGHEVGRKIGAEGDILES